MSRLLIPLGGKASKSFDQGTGITLSPGAYLASMKHDFKSNCVPQPLTNATTGNSQNAGEVCSLWFPGSNSLLYRTNIGALSAALNGPVISADGLALVPANKGAEISPYFWHDTGITAAEKDNYNTFTVGSSSAFYMKTTLLAATASDVTEVFVGFSRVQAYTADMNAKTDCYGVSIQAGNLFEFLTKNNTGTTTTETDTTVNLSNSTDMTIEVFVSAAGVATIKVDGALLDGSNGSSYTHTGMTFDSGDKVYPLIHAQSAADLYISEFEHGSQAAVQ